MRPLDGIRVVDLSRVLAGPYATLLLADMGAEVIKVEEPGHGDDTRAWPPFAGGESTYFMSVNRGKKSVALNLKHAAGQTVLRRLLEGADVLLENFRPGTLDRLGLGYGTVREWNPRLVYCSISGFGESGPEAGRPGYDLIVQGESGIMDLTGFPDGPPVKVGNSIADLAAGTMAAHGIVLALFAREKSGLGQKVEIAMLEVMAALLTYQGQAYFATGQSPRRRGNQHPSIVPYEVFQAADGYLTVGVANDSLWGRFCEALERPDLARDGRFATVAARVASRDALVPLLQEIMAARPVADWLPRLARAGVPAGKISTVGEVLESAQLRERGAIVSLTHATAGTLRMVGPPIRLHGTPAEAAVPPPRLGEHTDQVLGTLLGYSADAIARLRAEGTAA
jgi:formyl-CoA transferase